MTPRPLRATFIGSKSGCSQQVPPGEKAGGSSIILVQDSRRPIQSAPSTKSGEQPRAESNVSTQRVLQPTINQTHAAAEFLSYTSNDVLDIVI